MVFRRMQIASDATDSNWTSREYQKYDRINLCRIEEIVYGKELSKLGHGAKQQASKNTEIWGGEI